MLLDVWDSFEMMFLRLKGLHGRYKFKSQALLMDALTHASYLEHNNEALNVLGVRVL
jgi:dsRNA-specific ribonuclease